MRAVLNDTPAGLRAILTPLRSTETPPVPPRTPTPPATSPPVVLGADRDGNGDVGMRAEIRRQWKAAREAAARTSGRCPGC